MQTSDYSILQSPKTITLSCIQNQHVLQITLTAKIIYHQGSWTDGFQGHCRLPDARPYGENRFVRLPVGPLSAAESQTLWGKADALSQCVLCTTLSQQGRTT